MNAFHPILQGYDVISRWKIFERAERPDVLIPEEVC